MGKTRDLIRRLIEFSPGISNTQIAEAIASATGTKPSRALVSYHTRTMHIPRQSPNRSCAGCGKRITRYNSSGFCPSCRSKSYAYEFQCAHCQEVHVVDGQRAAARRYQKKFKKNPQLDFCSLSCSSSYFPA